MSPHCSSNSIYHNMTPYETMTRHFQNHSALSETDDGYPSKKHVVRNQISTFSLSSLCVHHLLKQAMPIPTKWLRRVRFEVGEKRIKVFSNSLGNPGKQIGHNFYSLWDTIPFTSAYECCKVTKYTTNVFRGNVTGAPCWENGSSAPG